MFPRIRELIDPFGRRVRLAVEARAGAALVSFERPGTAGDRRILFSGYGAEVVAGYIMAARLALPATLPDEFVGGPFTARLSLAHEPAAAIEIRQDGGDSLELPVTLWDKLYAELCMVIAHAREIERRADARVH